MKKVLVLFASVVLVAAFTLPAAAADWSFYGSSRMSTFYVDRDKESFGGAFDDTDLTWDQQGNSRIGANVKAGDVVGRFEYGDFSARLLYAEWDFGAGKLLVGQTYGPVNCFISNQVFGGDSDMLPYGGIYGTRNDMIRFRFGSFDVAFLENEGSAGIVPVATAASVGVVAGAPAVIPATAGAAGLDVDEDIPKLEARWNHTFGALFMEIAGGYQTFDVVDTGTDKEYSIDSYILYLCLKYSMGAFYINGDVYIGQNLANYGIWTVGAASATYNAATDDILDNDSFGWLLVGGFKVSDQISLEAGYGMAEHEPDIAGAQEDDVAAFYVQAVIGLAKGVMLVPEIGVIDFKDSNTGTDQGKNTYFGAKWQINF
jgi:hypothetical protein